MELLTRPAHTDPRTLADQLGDMGVYVLDVRQATEWRHGHIRGSHNLPLLQLKSRLATLPRDKAIVTVCASGHRSAFAARMLQRSGHRVENLKGGMHAWTKAGLTVEKSERR